MTAVTGLDYKLEVSSGGICRWRSREFKKKTTPVKKNLRPCEDSVVVSNGGYYSLASDNAKKLNIRCKISVLFEVEDNLFVGRRVICTKCFRRLEWYEAMVKELQERYKNNLVQWRDEVKENRSKRCSNSPGLGLKKARSTASSTTSDFLTVGNAANTSFWRIKLKIPSLCSGLNIATTLLTPSLTDSSVSCRIKRNLRPAKPSSKITVYPLRRCCCAVLFLAFFYNQSQPLLHSKICRWSLEANQLSRPKSDRNRFNLACQWLGVIKETALRPRGFSRG